MNIGDIQKFFLIIKKTDLIIFTYPISQLNIDKLSHKARNAKFIYNHAGSVFTFKNLSLASPAALRVKAK